MKALTSFVLLLILSLIAAALISYPLWLSINLVSAQPIHRVFVRAAMIAAIAGFVIVVRLNKLQDPNIRGFGLPARRFILEVAKGIPIGAALLTPVVILLFALDIRDATPVAASAIAGSLATGLAFGLVVAFLEELFCRGALQGALMAEHGAIVGIGLQAVYYASLHFIGGDLRIPNDEVTWASGFRILIDVLSPYAHFDDYLDAFLALVAVGILLGIVRARRGSIAMGIGMHAAWISLIYAIHKHSVLGTSDTAWLASRNYDGVIGWLAMAIIVPIVIIAARRWPLQKSLARTVQSAWLFPKIAIVGTLLVAGLVAKDISQGGPVTRGEHASN